MGASGGIVMSFFGAVFATMSLAIQMHLTGRVLALPFVAFAAIALYAVRTLRLPGQGLVRSKHAGRVIILSTIGEGIGLVVVANLVLNLGNQNMLIPAVAFVVGLHFLPMARYIPFLPFYFTGFALILSALIGIVVSHPVGGALAGFAAAAILWASAIMAIHRDRRLRLP
jgi:hypothetical protein